MAVEITRGGRGQGRLQRALRNTYCFTLKYQIQRLQLKLLIPLAAFHFLFESEHEALFLPGPRRSREDVARTLSLPWATLHSGPALCGLRGCQGKRQGPGTPYAAASHGSKGWWSRALAGRASCRGRALLREPATRPRSGLPHVCLGSVSTCPCTRSGATLGQARPAQPRLYFRPRSPCFS